MNSEQTIHLPSSLLRGIGRGIASVSKERRVCIITYHRILEKHDPLLETEPDVQTFSWQMKVLSENFNVMPLHDAILAIQAGTLPERAVCITFDDGYRSTHDLALPILQKYNLPATLFVTTAFLGEGNMWNDRIIEAIRRLPSGQLNLQDIGMGRHDVLTLEDRIDLVRLINAESKYLSPRSRQDAILKLESLSGVSNEPGLMLTRDMVRTLSNAGIEIGGHTMTHPILTKLDDDAAQDEIVQNKKVLEDIIGKPLRLFAYPNGKLGKDFDQRHMAMAKRAGYVAAFSTAVGAASKKSDLFRMPRSRPWDATPFLFQARLLRWLAGIGASDERLPTYGDKKGLLIAFHFPPQSASSGIQRTLSFTKNLPNSGWMPMVMSANPIAYEQKNTSQVDGLPPSTIVKRAFAVDSKRHLGIAGRYPELIALPDRWVSWLFFGVPTALMLIWRHKPKVIWSTFPIATAHLIGLCLHKITGLPWVADFRDPMMQPNYPKSARQRQIYAWIERATIKHCTKASFTTNSARQSYRERYPEQNASKFTVIENGFDADGFDAAEKANRHASVTKNEKIELLHSGVLYTDGRDPSSFFAAIAQLKKSNVLSSDNFHVTLRASGEDTYFISLVEQHGIQDIVDIAPPIAYSEALAEMLRADGLLLFQGTPFNRQIPAKIYEYFRAKKPIFGLLDCQGDTAKVLMQAGFTDLAEMSSAQDIVSKLHQFIQKIQLGSAYAASEEVVYASSREHRARQLSQLFEEVAEANPNATIAPSHYG